MPEEGAVILFAESNVAQDSREIERHLARALRAGDVMAEVMPEDRLDVDLSSREILQLAWDRAQQEIDELQAELRLLRQRHQEAERRLLARINQRKRLQQAMLESVHEPEAGVEAPATR
jgi:hypothetical protein